MTTTSAPVGSVIQSDREAVAALMEALNASDAGGREVERWRDGSFDKRHLLQAFAAYRVQIEQSSRVGEGGAMSPEEHRLADLKQMAAYAGPIVSFDVREPYYLASCDHCGWVGSSELCTSDEADDVFCPRCQTSGADCGKVAERLGHNPIPYSHAIGEAGQAYIKSVSSNGDAVLGGNFYYANLWDAMQKAALSERLRQALANPPLALVGDVRDALIEVLKRIDDGIYPSLDDQANAVLAALQSSPSSHVPEGYALVPVEPTPEMIDAGRKAQDDGSVFYVEDVYEAMLSAAVEKRND